MYLKRMGDLRDSASLKQREIAAYLGVNRGTYSDYERGNIHILIEMLIKLADYSNVSPDYLVGRSQNPKRLE